MPSPQDPTLRRCSRCRKWKPPGAADWYCEADHACKTCRRVGYVAHYEEDPEFRAAENARVRAWRAANRDQVIAYRQAHRADHAAQERARRATPLGKLRGQRSDLKSKLKHATTTERRLNLLAQIRAHDREIARLNAAQVAAHAAEETEIACAMAPAAGRDARVSAQMRTVGAQVRPTTRGDHP